MITHHRDTETKTGLNIYHELLSIKLEDKSLFQWLMNLDEKTIQKAFIYAGRTELSYLQLSWSDYQYDRIEFISQWNSILVDYYKQLSHN